MSRRWGTDEVLNPSAKRGPVSRVLAREVQLFDGICTTLVPCESRELNTFEPVLAISYEDDEHPPFIRLSCRNGYTWDLDPQAHLWIWPDLGLVNNKEQANDRANLR